MTQENTSSDDRVKIYDGILRSSKAFFYRCDNEEEVNMIFLSGCVSEITGCSSDELLNSRSRTYASLCHPDDLDDMIVRVDCAIAAREPWDVDYRLCRPDGSCILVRERGEARYLEGGKVEFLQGMVIDASEESNLRHELEVKSDETRVANQEILKLAQSIAKSVKELSMLSINARIEAARAGDAGRGFSVIASEIGFLAEANAALAEQISQRMRM